MKTVKRKCLEGYHHHYFRTANDCIEMDPGVWDRTVQLECSRCGYVLWIDSIIRCFEEPPQVWRGS